MNLSRAHGPLGPSRSDATIPQSPSRKYSDTAQKKITIVITRNPRAQPLSAGTLRVCWFMEQAVAKLAPCPVKVSVARAVHVLWISLERCLGTSPKELDKIIRKKVPTVSILTIPMYIPKVPKGSLCRETNTFWSPVFA